MRVRRSVAVAALLTVGALAGVAVGYDRVTAIWAEPKGVGAANGEEDATGQGAPPQRRNSLEISERTVYFLEGVLPIGANDGTTSGLAGSLVLLGQCHDGTLTVMISSADGNKETSVRCDGRPHERSLGRVRVGDTIGVRTTGRKGTDFAVELQAR